jgi:hypothetical protein
VDSAKAKIATIRAATASAHHHPAIRSKSKPRKAKPATVAPMRLTDPSRRRAGLGRAVPTRRLARPNGVKTTNDAPAAASVGCSRLLEVLLRQGLTALSCPASATLRCALKMPIPSGSSRQCLGHHRSPVRGWPSTSFTAERQRPRSAPAAADPVSRQAAMIGPAPIALAHAR